MHDSTLREVGDYFFTTQSLCGEGKQKTDISFTIYNMFQRSPGLIIAAI